MVAPPPWRAVGGRGMEAHVTQDSSSEAKGSEVEKMAGGGDRRGDAATDERSLIARVGAWISTPGAGVFLLGAALAFGVLGASDTMGRALRTMNQDNVIRVKGVAEIDVRSDRARWHGNVRVRAATLPEAYAALERSVQALSAFIESKGIPAAAINVFSADISRIYRKDDKGNATNEIEAFELRQQVACASNQVDVVRNLANGATSLIREGVEVESLSPTYTVSTIEKTKIDLLERATENAYERARTLARGSGSSVGGLVSASQGVFQIVARGSTSSSDYGEYDTGAIDKTARVVVTLEYAVR